MTSTNYSDSNDTSSKIGILRETSLHAALKRWYAKPGDQFEVPIDGYIVDILRQDLLIEIQTSDFSSIKQKLYRLLRNHSIRLVHPIPQQKWIIHLSPDGKTPLKRRKSPKHGSVLDLFTELVRFPDVVTDKNFFLEVLLIRQEDIWRDDGQGSWRRKRQSICDRRLVEVIDRVCLDSPSDFKNLLPPNLIQPFTTQELALGLGIPRYLAQKMAYCLHAMGVLERVGKKGRAHLYHE